jgi:hypothetical protein
MNPRNIGPFLITLIGLLGCAVFSTGLATNFVNDVEGIVLKDPGSFIDNNGRINIIGVIDNNGNFPVKATVAVNVTEGGIDQNLANQPNGSSNYIPRTVSSPTFARIIFPGEGTPFKIVLEPESVLSISSPFVSHLEQIQKVNYDILLLNYTNMAQGSERALMGTVENMAPFPVYNVTVYASVHDSNQSQIDSAISDKLSVIQPGERIQFMVTPDASAKSRSVYYSCAGVDLDAPITTLTTSDGGFIPFDLQALAKVIDLRYDDGSESIVFGIDHYNPEGGLITLKLPQIHDDQKLTIIKDGLPDNSTKMISDGKTIKIDIFIPPEEHQIEIKGVSYIK